jgi:hypothetical protein
MAFGDLQRSTAGRIPELSDSIASDRSPEGSFRINPFKTSLSATYSKKGHHFQGK